MLVLPERYLFVVLLSCQAIIAIQRTMGSLSQRSKNIPRQQPGTGSSPPDHPGRVLSLSGFLSIYLKIDILKKHGITKGRKALPGGFVQPEGTAFQGQAFLFSPCSQGNVRRIYPRRRQPPPPNAERKHTKTHTGNKNGKKAAIAPHGKKHPANRPFAGQRQPAAPGAWQTDRAGMRKG